MEQHTIVKNDDEVKKALYWDKRELEYGSLMKIGREFKSLKQFQVAGNVFIKAAELPISLSMDVFKKISAYESAARCFLQINDTRAKEFYRHAVDVYLENGYIEKGIQHCVEYGYEFQQKLGDTKDGKDLYTLANKLRKTHKLSHSCVIKQFVESKYGRDFDKVCREIQKFYIKIKHKTYTTISHTSLCMQCIDAYQKLHKYYREFYKWKGEENERETENLNRGKRTEEDLRKNMSDIIKTIKWRMNCKITKIIKIIEGTNDFQSLTVIDKLINDYWEENVTPSINEIISKMMENKIIHRIKVEKSETDEDIFEILREEIFGINIREMIERICEEIDKRREAERREKMEIQILSRIQCLTESIGEKLKISKELQLKGKSIKNERIKKIE